MSLLGFIPSPSSGAIHIGPLQLRAYGLMIALGVIAAVWLWGKRLEKFHIAPREQASSIALWCVPAGIIGARLYHVATDWQLFSDEPMRIVRIWEGGLGIPGGIFLGTVVALIVIRRRGYDLGKMAFAAAPSLPLAQAIGRLGNWWNQELFGRPTDVWWAVEIDPEHRPVEYADIATYHPTFLYECLWNLALCGLLLLAGRRMLNHRPWRLFALYTLGYGIGRLWIEGLRIDPAKEGGGLRLNQWTALVVIVASVVFLLVDLARYGRAPVLPDDDEGDVDDDGTSDETDGDEVAPEDGDSDDGEGHDDDPYDGGEAGDDDEVVHVDGSAGDEEISDA